MPRSRVARLVHFLHAGGVVVAFQGRHLLRHSCGRVVSSGVVFINAQAELDHPVDPVGVCLRVLQTEAGGEQRGLIEQDDQVLHGLVVLVRLRLLPQGLDDGVVGVDL